MGWGDEMMAAGEVSVIYDGSPVAILNSAKGSPRWTNAWDNNPQIQKPSQSYRKFIVNGPGARPYAQSCSGNRWYWKRYKPIPAPMFFDANELAFASKLPDGFIALEPNPKEKAEAVNRDWGWHNWVELAGLLEGHRILQFGPKGTKTLPGAELIVTGTPRLLAAGLTRAKGFVATEGGFHHTAASASLRGVVIFGHFISPEVTGYDLHKNLFSGDGLGCGSRIKCKECRLFMDELKPKTVFDELNKIL